MNFKSVCKFVSRDVNGAYWRHTRRADSSEYWEYTYINYRLRYESRESSPVDSREGEPK